MSATVNAPGSTRTAWWMHPLPWVEIFAVGNFAFLALDIYIAHSINAFAEPLEWVPLIYSLIAAPMLVVAMTLGGRITPWLPDEEGIGKPALWRVRLSRWIGLAIGWCGVIVGVSGLILHLESQFFHQQTIESLVYTAPFAAPLAYAGLGLLVLLDRMVDSRSLEWARWVVLLAMGGFVGNFVLTLADHAQNGFFVPAEWVAVVSAAYAVSGLLAVAIVPGSRGAWMLALILMGVQVLVGLIGFGYHVLANLQRPMETLWEDFLYGAPVFAPLLYPNLAILAVLGLWAIALAHRPDRRR